MVISKKNSDVTGRSAECGELQAAFVPSRSRANRTGAPQAKYEAIKKTPTSMRKPGAQTDGGFEHGQFMAGNRV
jgi:hypothetical protein